MKQVSVYVFAMISALLFMSKQTYAQYCTAVGPSNADDSNVQGVTLNGEVATSINYTGCPGVVGLQDATSQSVTLNTGNPYVASIQFGTCSMFSYFSYGDAWIDWNQNNVFEISESIGTWSGTPPVGLGSSGSFNFNVPSTAVPGVTRMRVMQWEDWTGSPPTLPLDPCGSFIYGSVVDFQVIVTGGTPITCAFPTSLNTFNVSTNSADLAWTDNSGSGIANIEYGPIGFTQGSGTSISGTTNNPESISGLSSATAYEFYVQSNCGLGDLSYWMGPFAFTTNLQGPSGVSCGGSTLVFSDDMESNSGWTGNIGTLAGTWDFPCVQPGGNSTDTGPSGPASGTTYAEYEASGSQALASLVTPMIDLSSGSFEAELSFYMHAYGAEIGTMNVGIGNSATGPFSTEFTWTGQYQTSAAQAWEHIGVDLSAYLGQQIYIQFAYAANGPNFYGDLAIDLVQVETCVSCPAPTNFNIISSDLTSSDFGWTENGGALEWELEYGVPGFSLGIGTDLVSNSTPQNVNGLTPDSFYEVYLRSVCAVGDTSDYIGPIGFNTFNQGIYMDHSTECPTAGFIDISATGTNLLLADDGESSVDPLPFPILFQGTLMNNMTVGNNGGLQLGAIGAEIGYGGVFTALADGTMFPWGDDLDDETGNVYYEVIGTSPNQTLIIQWDNSCNFSGSLTAPTVTFQIQIEETGDIYYVYDDVVFGGTNVADDFGAFADIGISGQNQDITISTNDTQYLTDNSCVRFYYTDCPNPINYTVNYTTFGEAGISWDTGLAAENNWTITYGLAGFDPTISGTTVTSTTSALIIPGLDDVTDYDVYIYADCNPGVLQSIGATGSFSTLPNCADITALSVLSASDSILTSWTFVENPGFPSTSFDIEYGNNGYTQGTGILVNADNNFTDTTMDVSLLSGALYDVYVQSLCGTDSSNFVGPFTITMPLDNDSTCLPENLMVDGTVYTFDKTGASSQLGEVDITPPITGYNTNDGWGQLGLTYSTWFTFEAPASGQVRINATDQEFAGQMAVYDVGDCTDFTTFTVMGANDNDVTGSLSTAPNFTVCGLTPGNTYYLMHDANSVSSTISNGGIYSLAISDITLEGGATNGMVDVCVGDTVDLFTAITGYDMGGIWYQEIPTLGLNGSEFVSSGLAYQVFNFQYEVINGCAMDSVVQQIEVYGPSSAGTDGTITACQNEPVNLLSGLSGNVDLGGTWYDPTNTVTSSAITSISIPGLFNYDYVTGNGVCPDDTANVILSVDPSCDYLNIEKVAFKNMSIFPNPTNGSVFVKNQGSSEVFNLELTDVNGKVIVSKNAAVNGTETTEVSLAKIESGFYLIRVFNDNADKTFRIIKE